MTKEALKALAKDIDGCVMELDCLLCERGRKRNVPRKAIAVIDLGARMLEAIVAAFAKDASLWAEFYQEVCAPRDAVLERVYAKALILGRCNPKSRPAKKDLEKAKKSCDEEGWAKRINALAGDALVDGLTVHAVACVLGSNTKLRDRFQEAIEAEKH